MNRNYTLLFLLVLVFNCTNERVKQPEDIACDNGTFVGNVLLSTQQEVDDFGAMCYSKIDGSLVIGAEFEGINDIVDLSSLSSLNQIFTSNPNESTGWLRIRANNLVSLNGLQNITSVNGLKINNCYEILDLLGLDALENIGGNPNDYQTLDIHSNAELTSLEGLNNLVSIGSTEFLSYIRFAGNPKLQNLEALALLEEINGEFVFETTILFSCGIACDGITGNEMLSDFCGIQGLFNSGNFDTENINISHNAYNPTVQDIIDGNCSQ